MTINRRQILQIATLGGIGTFATSHLVTTTTTSIVQAKLPIATDNQYTAQVDAGLNYFQQLANKQLPLAEALEAAIRTGDLNKAKNAYVESRPPYEQIEVLAAGFPETDTDIDARAYAIHGGEENPDFKGFHRIEALLYRDGDLKAALPYAEGLVASAKTLISDLKQRQNFNAKKHFEGMIALATEIPAKKISSEEETWSDQSLLIFKENWNGIYSQFKPFAEVVTNSDPKAANEVKEAYEAAKALMQPYFRVNRTAAAPYSSLNSQQRGQIVKVSYRLRDSLMKSMEVLKLA